ncbi:MAG: peptide chain release factor N(5)-glutamine methyltransferase [Victivallales bacterium]|nr:peptide chain release factor N(5)-glutamine methyltransferase [Victivallales bacterium]
MKKIIDYIKYAENNFPSEKKHIRRYEAEMILTVILDIKRIDLYIEADTYISEQDNKKILDCFKRIVNNEPIQHILGYAYFRELKLKVNNNVLIPRPETELIIDYALKAVKTKAPTAIDVGTGSGAIAISIAKELPESKVLAIDISSKALKTAEFNCRMNKLSNVSFLNNNLCEGIRKNYADVILANLPYITEEEYNYLDLNVKNYEPYKALVGGADGLTLINKLIQQSKTVLKKQGWIILEIGCKQGPKTVEQLKDSGCFSNIEVIKDLNNRDRFIIAQKNQVAPKSGINIFSCNSG